MSSDQTLMAMQRQIAALQGEIERLKTQEDLPADAARTGQANTFTADQIVLGVPLIQGIINGGLATVTDHFDTFSGWTWSSAGSYDGAPSSVSVATYPSHVLFVNDSTSEDHFCYLSGSVATRVIRARLMKGMQSYIGLRLATSDEATYIEIRLEDSAAATGLLRLVRYQNGLADAVLVDCITPGYVVLELGATSTGGFWYGAFTTNTPLLVVAGSGGWATTITRWGITFGQRGYASDGQRACGADWFTIAS